MGLDLAEHLRVEAECLVHGHASKKPAETLVSAATADVVVQAGIVQATSKGLVGRELPKGALIVGQRLGPTVIQFELAPHAKQLAHLGRLIADLNCALGVPRRREAERAEGCDQPQETSMEQRSSHNPFHCGSLPKGLERPEKQEKSAARENIGHVLGVVKQAIHFLARPSEIIITHHPPPVALNWPQPLTRKNHVARITGRTPLLRAVTTLASTAQPLRPVAFPDTVQPDARRSGRREL